MSVNLAAEFAASGWMHASIWRHIKTLVVAVAYTFSPYSAYVP